ncbi:hypothetical protein D3C73_1229260 [compost metagenome]
MKLTRQNHEKGKFLIFLRVEPIICDRTNQASSKLPDGIQWESWKEHQRDERKKHSLRAPTTQKTE